MLFYAKANTTAAQTADTGKIRLGGACRLPLGTAAETSTIQPAGNTGRLVANTKDNGKIRLGGACRLPVADAESVIA